MAFGHELILAPLSVLVVIKDVADQTTGRNGALLSSVMLRTLEFYGSEGRKFKLSSEKKLLPHLIDELSN